MPSLVCLSDKFRGTASAAEIGAAAVAAALAEGWTGVALPMSDGGEGFLDAVATQVVTGRVTGPAGDPVDARWGWVDSADTSSSRTAVVEVAQAAGLLLAGGSAANDPLAATTHGVGEQVVQAVRAGARTVLVGCGGSATTDGGWGLVSAVLDAGGLPDHVRLVAATDVRTPFLDAARVFGPQKGADPAAVVALTDRLSDLARTYRERFGVDVAAAAGAGAAGGLAGGVLALGGEVASGFDVVARLLDLPAVLAAADLVVTGEGRLDATSLQGKVVGQVLQRVDPQVPVHLVVGTATPSGRAALMASHPRVRLTSLEESFGLQRALTETAALVEEVVGSGLLAERFRD